MWWMSSRLGTRPDSSVTFLGSALAPPRGPRGALRCSLAVAFEKLDEPVEQVRGIVRSGRCLRVVLDAECLGITGLQPLDHVIVEADVADRYPAELRLAD